MLLLWSGVRGVVCTGSDDEYDDACQIWNGMIDRRPALVVRCTGITDVRRTVEFAREHELLLAVRGGGHNVAGNALCDGGLAIDLSPMRGVQVDTGRRRVWAQGVVSGATSTANLSSGQKKRTAARRDDLFGIKAIKHRRCIRLVEV